MAYGIGLMDQINTSSGAILGAGNATGFKNRIINGAMVIDQRNSGASVTPANSQYMIDRWQASLTQSSKYTAQQNAGSVATPAGFNNYLGFTSSSAYSVTSGDIFGFGQIIEGYNIADLNWGTSKALMVTLSFWVYSSLTGSFGGSVKNLGDTRNYPFSYSIPVANTWTQISISVPGDTTGTWGTSNGAGINIRWSLGCGSTYSGTAGAWTGTNTWQPTGSVSVVGTSGATFYITGVQLEQGPVATSFDYRDYGRELILCQRYFQSINKAGASSTSAVFSSYGATVNYAVWQFKVTMRTSPTISGTTVGTAESPTPDFAAIYSAGGSYAAFGYNGSTYGTVSALAEL